VHGHHAGKPPTKPGNSQITEKPWIKHLPIRLIRVQTFGQSGMPDLPVNPTKVWIAREYPPEGNRQRITTNLGHCTCTAK